jgi:protein tyrosine/serine phosphatase
VFVPAVLVLLASGCALLNGNLRVVEPGAYYRSGQMDGRLLDITIRRHGIKTVINLRGASPDESWYRDEIAVCEARAVAHYDLKWSMSQVPPPESLQEFVAITGEAERPLLVHCQGGVHRAAVAAACYRLMQGESVEAARGELGLFFNDAPIGQLLDLYEESNLPFEDWILEEYPTRYEEVVRQRTEQEACRQGNGEGGE